MGRILCSLVAVMMIIGLFVPNAVRAEEVEISGDDLLEDFTSPLEYDAIDHIAVVLKDGRTVTFAVLES